jgi:ABC-type multidrug transport system fused ATPase/permease subunit
MIKIEHLLRTIQACDRIVMLEGGSIVADGTYQELMQSSIAFKRLAGVGQEEALIVRHDKSNLTSIDQPPTA